MVNDVVRGGLQKQKKVKAGKINPFKAVYIKLRTRYRRVRKLERKIVKMEQKIRGKAKEQSYYKTLAQIMLPPRIEVFDTHLEFNKKIVARSIVFGIPTIDTPSYPPDITANTFNKFQNLPNNKARVMLSSKISKIAPTDAEKTSIENWRMLNVEAERSKIYNPGGAVDLGLEQQLQAVRNNHNEVWNRAENSFNTQTIITIKGSEDDVLNAESQVWAECSSARISKWVPDFLHLQAWEAALPSPNMDSRFIVQAPSVVSACLVASTNINTPSDDTGVLFAKNRVTGANVIFDPRKLGAFHGLWFGATRSGKTYSSHTFLMRLKDLLDFHIVYMSRKEPDRRKNAVSDYEAVANFYGDEAATIVLGEKGFSINPLHVLCNPKTLNDANASKSWDDYRRGISLFFKSWFDGEFSPNFEGMLEDTLDYVYDKKGIKRNSIKSWIDKKIPTITDCRAYWLNIMKDKEGQTFEDRRTAGAFYRKTRNAKPGGSMEYLLGDENGRTSFDLSKEWITIDLHKVDSRIQDALYIILTTALGVYYNSDTTRETLIFIDEARALLRNREMSSFIMDTVTMGGTKGVGVVLATQQPADLIKSGYKDELATNTFWSVVMGYGLDKQSVLHVKDFFGFSDSVIEDLLTCVPGEGVFIKGDEITPVKFEAIPLEKMVLENKFKEEKPEPVSGYRIKEAFLKRRIDGKNFIEKNGFMITEMLDLDIKDKVAVSTAESALIADGWSKHNVGWVTGGRGSTNLYYHVGDLDIPEKKVTRDGYGSMTLYHLHAQIQMAVFAMNKGLKATININNKADIEIEYVDPVSGKIKIAAVELEMPGSHTKQELIEKWGRLIPYDDYRFVTTNVKIFNGTGIDTSKIIATGQPFADWIESLIGVKTFPIDDSEVEKAEIKQEENEYENDAPDVDLECTKENNENLIGVDV